MASLIFDHSVPGQDKLVITTKQDGFAAEMQDLNVNLNANCKEKFFFLLSLHSFPFSPALNHSCVSAIIDHAAPAPPPLADQAFGLVVEGSCIKIKAKEQLDEGAMARLSNSALQLSTTERMAETLICVLGGVASMAI